jgi:hypothetical protein
MKFAAYKLNFTFKRWHFEGGVKVLKVHEYTRIELATNLITAYRKAKEIVARNSESECKFESLEEIKYGKVWKVTMDGTDHLRNSEDKLVDREDMHKVIFVDAFDMYDAEQVAYRIWEKQVVEEGWNDIMISRTLVVPKLPMVDRFEGGKNVA